MSTCCLLCDKMIDENSLLAHIKTEHFNLTKYKCKECDFSTMFIEEANEHENTNSNHLMEIDIKHKNYIEKLSEWVHKDCLKENENNGQQLNWFFGSPSAASGPSNEISNGLWEEKTGCIGPIRRKRKTKNKLPIPVDKIFEILIETWNRRHFAKIPGNGLTYARLKLLGSSALKFNYCRHFFLYNYSDLNSFNKVYRMMFGRQFLSEIALKYGLNKHCKKMCNGQKNQKEAALAAGLKVLIGIIFRQADLDDYGKQEQKQLATILGIKTEIDDSNWLANIESDLKHNGNGICWNTLNEQRKLADVEGKLNYEFKNKVYLVACIENDFRKKFAYLGDAILEYLVIRHLFNKFPLIKSNHLSMLKIYLVTNQMLAQISMDMDLHKLIKTPEDQKNANIAAENPMNIDLAKDKDANSPADENPMNIDLANDKDANSPADENPMNIDLANDKDANSPADENPMNIDLANDKDANGPANENPLNTDLADKNNDLYKKLPKSYADIFEALVAAVYLDSGGNLDIVWESFEEFFTNIISKHPLNQEYSL